MHDANPLLRDLFSACRAIPRPFLLEVEGRVNRLNRRAVRLGTSRVELRTGAVTVNSAGCEFVEATISGRAPRLPCGWYLLGYAYSLGGYHDQTILIIPGRMKAPDVRAMATVWRCDHCGVQRQGRREAFVFRNENSREVVVGSCCIDDLADEIGYLSPATLVWTAQVMDALNLRNFKDVGGDGPLFVGYSGVGDIAGAASLEGAARGIVRYAFNDLWIDVEDAVAAAACAIRHFGWSGSPLSSPAFDVGHRTSELLNGFLEKNRQKVVIQATDVDIGRAALIWANESISCDTNDDELGKLRILSQLNWVPRSKISLAASMIATYQEAMGRAPTGEPRSDPSRHAGLIGQRADLVATVERIFDVPTTDRYGIKGVRHIHLFRDPAGNVLKWTVYSEQPIGPLQRVLWRSPRLVEGQVYVLRDAIVMMHEDWRGVAQTVLGQCNPKLIRR